jgi:lycopene cyclase domain-containing protein
MSLEYFTYLLLALAGTVALKQVFSISFSRAQKKAILFSLACTTILFSAWDSIAVELNHWQFGLTHMLGFTIGNQPLEEILFFMIIPFFGIVVWEIAGKVERTRAPKADKGEKK